MGTVSVSQDGKSSEGWLHNNVKNVLLTLLNCTLENGQFYGFTTILKNRVVFFEKESVSSLFLF